MKTWKVKEILKSFQRKFPSEVKEFVKQSAVHILQTESKSICSTTSSFKIQDVSKMKECMFEELERRAPMLFSCVTAVGLNPRNKRCKKKSDKGIFVYCLASVRSQKDQIIIMILFLNINA